MSIFDYPKSRAIVIERPYEVRLREIELTVPQDDAYIARTTFSAISTGTDMKTYKGLQHPEQCWYPLVPGYETAGVVEAVGSAAPLSLKVGDRVMINESRKYKAVCGTCRRIFFLVFFAYFMLVSVSPLPPRPQTGL